MENRNVEIVEDKNGKKIVRINTIRFKGKRKVDWSNVESYLSSLVGDSYKVSGTGDLIYIGTEFPSEYSGLGHKKRNEQPVRILRFYLAQNPFLFYYSIR